MKRLLSSLALAVAALAALAAAPSAFATVLDFDDLAEGAVPAGYGGLDWSTGDWSAFADEGVPFTPHSGSMAISTAFSDTGAGAEADAATAIGLGAGMTFQGAWFAGFEDVHVTFELFDHGKNVATSSTLATSATPAWLASGYAGPVDEVIVSSDAQDGFVMDDFTFAAAVPEPGSTALMAGGLLLFAAVARRRA